MRNQQAVVVGESVVLPMCIRFDDMCETKRPQSDTASFATQWHNEALPDGFVACPLKRWRRQIR